MARHCRSLITCFGATKASIAYATGLTEFEIAKSLVGAHDWTVEEVSLLMDYTAALRKRARDSRREYRAYPRSFILRSDRAS